MSTSNSLTKFQMRALYYAAHWDHAYGGLAEFDGRSAQELIKRGWVENCVLVKTTMNGVMSSGMRYVITAEGRKAACELGWKPGDNGWLYR